MSDGSAATGILASPAPASAQHAAGRHRLGPGLITGAADDDPSGIVTYTQAGAGFGYSLGWSLLLTLPFMGAVQEISARLGRVTGCGLAATLLKLTPRWFVLAVVAPLMVASTINLGADIAAMGDCARLLLGGPGAAWSVLVAAFCAGAEVWLAYKRYVQVLKWLTAALLAYLALLFAVHVPLGAVVTGILVPHVPASADAVMMIVALFGTTISPYLFFWQAAEEVEEIEADPAAGPLRGSPRQAPAQLARIHFDTWTGMIYSNMVGLAIMIGAAATLHAHHITSVDTAEQAALALAPIAGPFARALFAAGIFGTGLLAVPVLAGSSAYALADAMEWRVGLARAPREAKAFYATLIVSTLLGLAIALSPIDPMKALVWAAVINGVLAGPMIVLIVALGSMRRVMGEFVLPLWLRALGWVAALVMGAAVVAMLAL